MLEALPHAMFRVELDGDGGHGNLGADGQRVLAHVAEEARKCLPRILPGNKVALEITPYDLKRGRIVAVLS